MPSVTKAAPASRLSAGFIVIIAFKYLKAAVFALVGFTALHLARLSSMPTVADVAHFFRSPENEVVRRIAALIREVTPHQAVGFGVISLLVAGVFATEGTLLACRIWWSTYFTIVLTSLGLPLEIYEIVQRPASIRRYVLLAVNAAILVYLWKRRNEFRDHFTHREGTVKSAGRKT